MSDRLSNTKQDKCHLCFARGTELVAALMLSLSTPALAAESIKINDLVEVAVRLDACVASLEAVKEAFHDTHYFFLAFVRNLNGLVVVTTI